MSTRITTRTIRRVTIKREPQLQMISIEEMHEEQRDIADSSTDPYEVIRMRTKIIAHTLGCSEAEAERAVLGREFSQLCPL